MWAVRHENLTAGRRYLIERHAQPTSFAAVIAGWQTAAAFRAWFNTRLADAPYRKPPLA